MVSGGGTTVASQSAKSQKRHAKLNSSVDSG